MAAGRRALRRLDGDRLLVSADPPLRCASSTVLGGGIGPLRTWLNLQVPLAYARLDPITHLQERAADLAGPVVGTMTAAEVADAVDHAEGDARVIATVGLSVPLAAAGSAELHDGPGTINVLALVDQPLTDAGLVNAVQTVTEAKAQALAEAGVRALNHDGPATGTATDSVVVACAVPDPPPAGQPPGEWPAPTDFAGPASPVGHDLAVATHAAITEGVARWRRRER